MTGAASAQDTTVSQHNDAMQDVLADNPDETGQSLDQDHQEAMLQPLQTHGAAPETHGYWGGAEWTYDVATKTLVMAPQGDTHVVYGTAEFLTKNDGELATKSEVETVRIDHTIDLWNPSQLASMFRNARNLTTVQNIHNLKVKRYFPKEKECWIDLSYMFAGTNIQSVDFSQWDFGDHIINANSMFAQATTVATTDFNIPFERIGTARDMFWRAGNLERINIAGRSGVKTAQWFTDAYGMFENCDHLRKVVWKLATPNLERLAWAFARCGALEEADLNGMQSSAMRYSSQLFTDCSKLKTVDLTGTHFLAGISTDMFANTAQLTSITLLKAAVKYLYTVNNKALGSNMLPHIAKTNVRWNAENKSLSWQAWAKAIALSDESSARFMISSQAALTEPLTAVEPQHADSSDTAQAAPQSQSGQTWSEQNSVINGDWGGTPWTLNRTTGELVFAPDKSADVAFGTPMFSFDNQHIDELRDLTKTVRFAHIVRIHGAHQLEAMFSNFGNLESVEGFENIDFGKIPDTGCTLSMRNMFAGTHVQKLDLSKVYFRKHTINTRGMFERATITNVDSFHIPYERVTNAERMFSQAQGIDHVEIAGPDRSKAMYLTTAEEMFAHSSVTSVNWKLASPRLSNLRSMFLYCRELVGAHLNGMAATSVQIMDDMFYCCRKLDTVRLIDTMLTSYDPEDYNNIFRDTAIQKISFSKYTFDQLYQQFEHTDCASLPDIYDSSVLWNGYYMRRTWEGWKNDTSISAQSGIDFTRYIPR
ncbi:BspA family leucine-rich repeat surface protein [Bifidobacterium dolichotidis]|uniref:BspA family leucine-rich repeat surface protein n=1 Tax=Bifidobacterium dolichotidis TaxID=2306976 RepID=UPI0013DDA82E|nr:BspA family leucine-rich repeat surface protein [Bifidobacterium dolichotidis]